MPKRRQWSRREFLIAAALLAGCAPRTVVKLVEVTVTPSPTSTPPPPTETPEPTATVTTVVGHGGFEMVLVEAGSFQMGSTNGKPDEQPIHTVNITRPFYVSKHEVTFEQYDEFCDDTTREKLDDNGWGRGNRPATIIVWSDAVEYCNWLSEKEGLTPCYSGQGTATQCDFLANGYRLPTEAEWEYAARGGDRSQGFVYPGSDNVGDVGWYVDNSDGRAQPVGQKQPNELGLYDMGGNVWEFCWDWYDKNYYSWGTTVDPQGTGASRVRVLRGGCWNYHPRICRSANRSWRAPGYRLFDVGFRVILVP